MQLSPGKQLGMKRISDQNGIFKMTAVDQRPPIINPIKEFISDEKQIWNEVARFKKLLVKHLQDSSSALLLDPHYALPVSMDIFKPDNGLIVTLEDSKFEENNHGRLSKNIDNWNVSKIKRMGADAVKVLTWYRPDADKNILYRQQEYVQKIGEDCKKYDILFLLELLVYPLQKDENFSTEYLEMKNKKKEDVFKSVEEFAKSRYCVDIFKLESPINAENITLDETDFKAFQELHKLCLRPWVMLSAGAGKKEFKTILHHAFKAGASGFLAGRAIWLNAFQNYPSWQEIESTLKNSSKKYLSEISDMADKEALPWFANKVFNQKGKDFIFPNSTFRNNYQEIENS